MAESLPQVLYKSKMASLEVPFPFMSLPRELRNRIYQFHLEDTCMESRPCISTIYGSVQSEMTSLPLSPIQGKIYPGFYQPVFVRKLQQDDEESNSHGWPLSPDFEAREYPFPVLAQLNTTYFGREAWYQYMSKLLVDVDALNRFQTWYLESLPQSLSLKAGLGLRRLYIAARSIYSCSANSNLPGMMTTSNDYPSFLVAITDDQQEMTVSTRFEMQPHDSNILRSNLDTMLKERLKDRKTLDGDDLIEASFAFHCKIVAPSRQSCVVGPLKKDTVRWNFDIHDIGVLNSRGQPQDTSLDVLWSFVVRSRCFEHIVYRRRVGQIDSEVL